MNKADIGLLDELTQVLADINEKCGTDFKLLPLKASSGEFHLLNNERVLFRGKLNVCDYYIAGMLLLAVILKTEKTTSEEVEE